MEKHSEYHYSITIETGDEAVLHCLRALSQYAQLNGNKRIPWGGTKKSDWKYNNHQVTFHFSRASYRSKFEENIFRILPGNLWRKVDINDNDPAIPQS